MVLRPYTLIFFSVLCVLLFLGGALVPGTTVTYSATVAMSTPLVSPVLYLLPPVSTTTSLINQPTQVATSGKVITVTTSTQPVADTSFHQVPFYSQLTDISDPAWQPVGCGIASVAMLIDFYTDTAIDVDELLYTGIRNRAYLDNQGWIHAGLIELAQSYGLDGSTQSLAQLSMSSAYQALVVAVKEGPVMVSVHYTFDPSNPIPHLVVVTGADAKQVYYNDPAEPSGQSMIKASQFQLAWKQRYIEIHPRASEV